MASGVLVIPHVLALVLASTVISQFLINKTRVNGHILVKKDNKAGKHIYQNHK